MPVKKQRVFSSLENDLQIKMLHLNDVDSYARQRVVQPRRRVCAHHRAPLSVSGAVLVHASIQIERLEAKNVGTRGLPGLYGVLHVFADRISRNPSPVVFAIPATQLCDNLWRSKRAAARTCFCM